MSTIRRLNHHTDAEIFKALIIEAAQDTPAAFCESAEEVAAKPLSGFADLLDDHGRGDFVLGAFDDTDNLVGIVGLCRSPFGKQRHKAMLWGMYVTINKRQQGIGRQLIHAAINNARTMPGILHINLSTTGTNDAANHLYTSLGFRIYGVEPKSVNFNGTYFDETWMQLEMSAISDSGIPHP